MKKYFLMGAGMVVCLPGLVLGGGEADALRSVDGVDRENSDSWLSGVFDGANRLDLQVETLRSSDVDIDQYDLQFEIQKPIWNFSLTAGHTDYGLDYVPAIVGSENFLSEQSTQLQARVGVKLGSALSLDFSARHYDGFSGYRSIWIAERFRQEFDFSSTYVDPDPGGYSYSLGAVYGYLPGHSVRVSVGYGRDRIAPGYSFGGTGVERSRDTLFRRSATLRFEDVWTVWLKSEHVFNFSDVTLREERWSARSTWHMALGDDWTLRLHAGYSEEAPLFEAKYGGVSLEWNIYGKWYVSAGVDVYSDTGEIPNAGLVSVAAPGVDTVQYGVGLRWVGESSAFRVYAALYENDYDALDINNQFLRNLYRDRDWVLVQASYTYQF